MRSTAISLLTLVSLATGTSIAVVESPGSLDPTFGRDGRVTTDFSNRSSGRAIATLLRFTASRMPVMDGAFDPNVSARASGGAAPPKNVALAPFTHPAR